jgi:hypothetical protein
MCIKTDKFHPTEPLNQTGQQERRRNHDRRIINDRRSKMERRCDFREDPNGQSRTLHTWLRSLIKTRLGVDRRKRQCFPVPDPAILTRPLMTSRPYGFSGQGVNPLA